MKIYNPLIEKLKDQRGGVAIIVAILVFFVLIGIMALAIDVGRLYTTKNELQNVADASALAGAGKLGDIYAQMTPGEQDTHDFSADRADIVLSARGVVGTGNNKVAGEDITINEGDIIIYNMNDAIDDLLCPVPLRCDSDNYNLPDSVRVTARRDMGSAEGPITNFFAQMFGIDTTNVQADATAALTTLDEVGPGEMNMPIGLSENWFDPEPNCEDTIRFSPTTSSCAGWHNFFDPINANAMNDKLLGFILDDPTIHSDGGPDDGDYGDCAEEPCGRTDPADPLDVGWLDVYFNMNPNQVPPAAYTPGVDADSEMAYFEFQGGTISALFNGGVLDWQSDNVTPVMDGGDPPQQVVIDDPIHPAPFFAIFDYFRFRDGIPIGDGISVDTDGDGEDDLTVTNPDAVWSGLVPVYEDEDYCINPNDLLKIVGFAVIHVIMPNPPPDSTVVAKIDCDLTFIGGQGGGGTSGIIRGTIPNLVE